MCAWTHANDAENLFENLWWEANSWNDQSYMCFCVYRKIFNITAISAD